MSDETERMERENGLRIEREKLIDLKIDVDQRLKTYIRDHWSQINFQDFGDINIYDDILTTLFQSLIDKPKKII